MPQNAYFISSIIYIDYLILPIVYISRSEITQYFIQYNNDKARSGGHTLYFKRKLHIDGLMQKKRFALSHQYIPCPTLVFMYIVYENNICIKMWSTTVFSKRNSHSLVCFAFVVVIMTIIINKWCALIHTPQCCVTGTGANVWNTIKHQPMISREIFHDFTSSWPFGVNFTINFTPLL